MQQGKIRLAHNEYLFVPPRFEMLLEQYIGLPGTGKRDVLVLYGDHCHPSRKLRRVRGVAKNAETESTFLVALCSELSWLVRAHLHHSPRPSFQ